eukprot:SAG25_NODE_11813_length_294_cov_1.066667_1_plen_86_part_01
MSRRFLSRNIEDGHACTGQQERTSEDFCDALTGDEIKAFQLIVFGQPLSDQELQQARPPPRHVIGSQCLGVCTHCDPITCLACVVL